MDAQVIFPSVVHWRRIIKSQVIKENTEESVMGDSNRTQMIKANHDPLLMVRVQTGDTSHMNELPFASRSKQDTLSGFMHQPGY